MAAQARVSSAVLLGTILVSDQDAGRTQGVVKRVRFGRPQDFLAVFVPPSPAVACPARLLPLSPRSTSSELGDNDYSR